MAFLINKYRQHIKTNYTKYLFKLPVGPAVGTAVNVLATPEMVTLEGEAHGV